jgi:hypothetical protein
MSRRMTIRAPLVLIAVAACVGQQNDREAQSSAQEKVAGRIEGFYAICTGAEEHRETLILRDGAFDHYVETHGVHGGRSLGTYSLVGDTIVMNVAQHGPAPDDTYDPLKLDYDFVIGEYAGFQVLWRGREMPALLRPGPAGFSDYLALYYGGLTSDRHNVPTCEQVITRLGRQHSP